MSSIHGLHIKTNVGLMMLSNTNIYRPTDIIRIIMVLHGFGVTKGYGCGVMGLQGFRVTGLQGYGVIDLY